MNAALLQSKHLVSRVLHVYADARIGATRLEKTCYKQSNSILLTFDDYGSSQQISDILRILKSYHVKAAFFLQGDWAENNQSLVTRIARDGHVVGNHSYSHPVLTRLTPGLIRDEISKGLPGPWFRPPQGRYNAKIRVMARELGYVICYWTIDSRDWTGASVEEMKHTILSELRPGATILMHLHGEHTREMLPSLITDIRARGYELTSHSETWLPTTA